MPEVDEQTLSAARSGRKEALVRVLAVYYPQVWRMSMNLVGDPAVGRRVVESVMRQSIPAAEGWDHEEAPPRWFRHHTVLATREATRGSGPRREDVLRTHGPADPGYSAFVAALRKLDTQQGEAFLLHHGEGFELRQLGIAMDCSVEAAGVHLRRATSVLEPLAGEEYKERLSELKKAYLRSEPDRTLALPYARRLVRRGFWGMLGVVLGWIVLLAFVGAVAWGVWWVWPRVVV